MSDRKPDRIIQERHRYDFSDQERSALGLMLARRTRELDDLQEQKKAAVAEIAEEIASTKKVIRSLTNSINDGWELRPVKVAVFFHTPKVGSKRLVRLDTGEIVGEVDMTDEEKQITLPGILQKMEKPPDPPAPGEQPESDPLLEDAIKIVREAGKVTTSLLQTKLRIGYARAAHLIDLMEARGVVGPPNGLGPRDLLPWTDSPADVGARTDKNAPVGESVVDGAQPASVSDPQGKDLPPDGCVFCISDPQGEWAERHAPCCKFRQAWEARNPGAPDPPVMKMGICSGCSKSTWINPAGFCLRCEEGEEDKPENQPKKKRGRKGKGAAAGAGA